MLLFGISAVCHSTFQKNSSVFLLVLVGLIIHVKKKSRFSYPVNSTSVIPHFHFFSVFFD